MGYVVKHAQLRGVAGIRDVVTKAVDKVVTTVKDTASNVASKVTPPAVPVFMTPVRHPSLPQVTAPPAPNNPFRAKKGAPAATDPKAPTWDGWWGGKTADIQKWKTSITVAGETGMPTAAACAMILDNFILGDLSLGTGLYDALAACITASQADYRSNTDHILGHLKNALNGVMGGSIVPPGGATGGRPATSAPPDQAWVDNSVPPSTPGETTALPGGTATTYSMPSADLIPGVPNLALAGAAALTAFVLLRRKR